MKSPIQRHFSSEHSGDHAIQLCSMIVCFATIGGNQETGETHLRRASFPVFS